jgi:cell division protein ZapA (FtsZ GTPase activity inhibitor)
MNQKEITIAGKQYPVVFTMKTMMGFENISGKKFFGADFEHLSDQIAIVMAAILAADESADIKAEDLINADNFETVKEIISAYSFIMNELAADFFKIPSVEPKVEPVDEKESEDPKN